MADNEKKQKTISKRQSTLKKEFLGFLQENGLIQVACRKTGISRMTYYRWYSDDTKFARDVERALRRGREVGIDMAESVIMGKIAEKDLGASKFYLQHNDMRYMSPTRIQQRRIMQEWNVANEELTAQSKDPKDLADRQRALAQEYEQKLRELIVEGRREIKQ